MKKFIVALLVGLALLGAGCFSAAPVTPAAPTSVKNQVNGIASSQEVLRAHGLLIVEAQTKGVEPSRISDWRERGQAAAQLIQEGRYEEATRAVEALNAEMRAELE